MPVPLEWVKGPGGSPEIREYPEGTSETFKKGALVIFDVSEDGVVEVSRTAGVPGDQNFLGIALKDATGTAGKVIPVLIPRAGDVFKASLASDQDTDAAIAADDRGKLYGIIKRASGTPAGSYVLDNATTTWVKVIDLNPEDVAKRGGDLVSASFPTFTAGQDALLFKFQEAVLDNVGSQA